MTTLIAASDSDAIAVCLVILYFVPTVVAGCRHHHQMASIVVVNLFLGWTFIGWVAALAMACSAVKQPATTTSPPR